MDMFIEIFIGSMVLGAVLFTLGPKMFSVTAEVVFDASAKYAGYREQKRRAEFESYTIRVSTNTSKMTNNGRRA